MRWRTFIVASGIILFVWHCRRHPNEQSVANQEIQQPKVLVSRTPKTHKIPPPDSPTAEPNKSQPTPISQITPTTSENPYHADPFKYRKLNAPMPSSLKDLLSKRTKFKEPQLPDINPQVKGGDGEVLTGKCDGFYREKSGDLKPIYFSRDTGGIGIGFGDGKRGSGHAEWSTSKGNLKVANYNDDPYSLILEFGSHYLIYLKFHSWSDQQYGRGEWRYMNGYLISNPPDSAETLRVVMVEDSLLNWDLHERDPRDPPIDWPKLFEQLAPTHWE